MLAEVARELAPEVIAGQIERPHALDRSTPRRSWNSTRSSNSPSYQPHRNRRAHQIERCARAAPRSRSSVELELVEVVDHLRRLVDHLAEVRDALLRQLVVGPSSVRSRRSPRPRAAGASSSSGAELSPAARPASPCRRPSDWRSSFFRSHNPIKHVLLLGDSQGTRVRSAQWSRSVLAQLPSASRSDPLWARASSIEP